jgi:hypothetical protein
MDVIKVSDWSQKYKIFLYVFGLCIFIFVSYSFFQVLNDIRSYLQIIVNTING